MIGIIKKKCENHEGNRWKSKGQVKERTGCGEGGRGGAVKGAFCATAMRWKNEGVQGTERWPIWLEQKEREQPAESQERSAGP